MSTCKRQEARRSARQRKHKIQRSVWLFSFYYNLPPILYTCCRTAYSVWLHRVHCYTSNTVRGVRHARQSIAASCNASYACVENRWIASTCAVSMHKTRTHMRCAAHTRSECFEWGLPLSVCTTCFGRFCENTDLSKTSLGRLFYLARVCIVYSLYWARCDDDGDDWAAASECINNNNNDGSIIYCVFRWIVF